MYITCSIVPSKMNDLYENDFEGLIFAKTFEALIEVLKNDKNELYILKKLRNDFQKINYK